jgi:hypothetical protein
MLKLLGVLAVIGAIAPVAMAGGAMIAAFMMGKNMGAWIVVTVATMVSVVLAGLLGLQVLMPMAEAGQTWAQVAAALVLLAAPWAALWAGKKLFRLEDTPSKS